ncbi:MAG: hypothetical protein MZV70_73595 [Desulfobacterales bacterium]|nr:hypothetical protein [Desulfobacterales bacterium]
MADELAVYPAHLDTGNRARERDVGDPRGLPRRRSWRECRDRCPLSAESTVAMICVSLRKFFREERADRPVDQPAGQGLVFGGTAFTLEEAAGNLAAGIGLFLDNLLSRGRNPGLPLLFLAATAVTSTMVSPHLHYNRSICLFGHPACFDR